MTAPDAVLARCEALRDGTTPVSERDVAWLVGCFAHPLKVVQRTAGEALAALAAGGMDVGRALEDAMGEGPFRRRWVAAWTASRIPGGRSAAQVRVLLEAIGADDGDVRWAAARILTDGEPTRELVASLAALASGGGAGQRKMALYCLRDLGRADDEAVLRYRDALGDPSPGVRLAGMSALQRIRPGHRDDGRRIAALLDDPDGGVRRAAAATLGRMGVADPEVLARLDRAAESDDDVLARTARAARARLG
ncbi:MAG TPA: HEAT repeat domain-containing protein [Gemmatimonadaceae bacterium]